MLHRQFYNDFHEVEYVLLLSFYHEHQADLPQKQSSIDHLTAQLKLCHNVRNVLFHEENEPLRNMADYKRLITEVSKIRSGIMKHRDRLLALHTKVSHYGLDQLEALEQVMNHGIKHAELVIEVLQSRREQLQA